jgi:hypothetical protein
LKFRAAELHALAGFEILHSLLNSGKQNFASLEKCLIYYEFTGARLVDERGVSLYYGQTAEAGVAKLVYAPDSKSGEVKLMSVRVRPPAPNLYTFLLKTAGISLFVQTKSKTFCPADFFRHPVVWYLG